MFIQTQVKMLQKRVIRVITGSEFLAPTNVLLHDNGILKCDDIHKFLLLLYFFNNRDKFSYSNDPYFTGNSNEPIFNIID